MRLYYTLSDDFNTNYIVRHSDNSFGSDAYFDFQVSLTNNCSFFLNFDIYSKKCVSCEGYLLVNRKTSSENIVIEKFDKGELLIELENFEKEAPIIEYFLDDKIRYDISKSRICIGNINRSEIIMFGIGQYASFQNNKLIGVIIDLK